MQKGILLLVLMLSYSVTATEYIIKTKPGKFVAFGLMQGMSVEDTHEVGRLTKVDIVDPSMLEELRNMDHIEYVVENIKMRSFRAPMSLLALRQQWHLATVNAEKAWKVAKNKGSKSVKVAVIDTGVDYDHESLAPNMLPGYDFHENDNDPNDIPAGQNPGHGTHCAGIVGATGVVDGGVIGISPTVSIIPLRFLGANGSGDLMNAVKAIDYAIKEGAKIISASWGAEVSRSQAQPVLDAVKRADDAGVIFIAAAGNSNKNNDSSEFYPTNAGFPNTISVAASDQSDKRANFSNYGEANVHVSAPGVGIMSTTANNRYAALSGTSMATPLVSGLVALMAAQDSDITGAQARAVIQATGKQTKVPVACNCRVDAEAAVKAVLEKKLTVVPAAASLGVGESTKFAGYNNKGDVTFSVSDANIAEIAADGTLKAKAKGVVKVSIKDIDGRTATSLNIRVGQKTSAPGGGSCPFGNPAICQAICQINPSAPFCK